MLTDSKSFKGVSKLIKKLCDKESKGDRPFYRPYKFQRKERNEKNKSKKNNWFRNKDENIKAVIFVEATPRNELINKLKETEDKFRISDNERIKFIQKGGKKIKDVLRNSDLFRQNCTSESNCFPCKGKSKFSFCRKSNVGYRLQCKLYKSRGIDKAYEGESGRNMFLRSREHVRQLQNKHKDSIMYKHIKEEHNDEKDLADFEMVMTNPFKTPLSRIINEGIRIKNREKNSLLNSKAEHYGSSVKRRGTELVQNKCNQCNFKTTSKKLLGNHRKQHHENIPVACKKHEENVKRKEQLEAHKQMNHERNPNECDQCDNETRDRKNFNEHHARKHIGKSFNDNLSTQQFNLQNLHVDHIQKKHDDIEQYGCD